MTDDLAAQRLLASLRNDGLSLSVADGKLWVSPTDEITEGQRAGIVAHRDALVALVIAEGGNCPGYPPLASPADLWGRLPPWPAGRWAGNITRETVRDTSAGCASHEVDGSLSPVE